MDQETIIKYISGEADEQEKSVMAEWLDENPENMREFLTIRKLYDITLWQEEGVNPKLILRQPGNKFRIGKLINEALKIAAVFAIAIAGIRYIPSFFQTNGPVTMQTIHVPAGQRAQLTLVDGTKVWLNANTTFHFPNRFSSSNREVALDGEGYFDVTHDERHPFVVKTHKYKVKAWGTVFDVLAYSGKEAFEASLLEGSIELMKAENDKGVYIKPNERIFLSANELVQAPITNFNLFLWKDGLITFNNETFPEMVNRLELYFDLKIEVKNDAILKYNCTGKFRTKDGIEHILKVLQLSNKFSFKMDDKKNIVTIE